MSQRSSVPCVDQYCWCLNVASDLQIWACTPGDANQQLFFDLENGSIQWENKDMCVDLTNGSLANGNQLQMVTCNQESDDYTQVWQYGEW
ncbi:hypothetical protein K438DRAFT_1996197 [Mycena galopus ATCC 62051]|nr:hypothetical protein K438DRAFT_1996197 [Mycena galopus ATCC 62051]